MPKYTFECQCGHVIQKYVNRSTSEIECLECGKQMPRRLPTLSGPADVNETIDSYTNTVHKQDHKEQVQKRRDEYYWKVEVPRLVNSGTYSVETMIEMGWIYLDEKGDIRTHTKPPHKR